MHLTVSVSTVIVVLLFFTCGFPLPCLLAETALVLAGCLEWAADIALLYVVLSLPTLLVRSCGERWGVAL